MRILICICLLIFPVLVNAQQDVQLLERNDSLFVQQGKEQVYVNEDILNSMFNEKKEALKKEAEKESLILELIAIRERKNNITNELNFIQQLLSNVRKKNE